MATQATQEEIQKLVMQVEGERELRKLVDQQTQAEKVMGKLIDEHYYSITLTSQLNGTCEDFAFTFGDVPPPPGS